MAGRRFKVAPSDRVRFTLTGETSGLSLEAIETLAGELCANLNIESRPLVSPSTLIEILPQPGGSGVVAITEDSIAQYFSSTGMDDRSVARESGQYYAALEWHLVEGHSTYFGSGYGPRYRADECGCPLTAALGIDDWSQRYMGLGIEPFSFLDFTAMGEQEIIDTIGTYGNCLFKVGPRRAKVYKQMRERLMADIQVKDSIC